MYNTLAWYSRKPERGIKSSGSKVTESWELLCRYWESNLGPLQERHVHLITEHLSGPKPKVLEK